MMKIYHHNVFETWPLEDKSVQAIITSPPYWSLRKYDIPDVAIGGDINCEHKWDSKERWLHRGTTKSTFQGNEDRHMTNSKTTDNFCIVCNAWKGQYGLEPSFKDYIEHTGLWAKEAHRVLRDDGVMFINLGDSYQSTAPNTLNTTPTLGSKGASTNFRFDTGFPSKCKLLIPHRMAIAIIDDGWILRNDIVWFKPNAMPESCRDRFSKKFEYVFMFLIFRDCGDVEITNHLHLIIFLLEMFS